jgi:hypothetical protein
MDKENNVNFMLTEDEAIALIDTLDIARVSFANIIKNAGDDVSTEHLKQLAARMNLCGQFIYKLSANMRIGEPADKQTH